MRLPGEMLCGQHLTKAPISLRNCPHSFSTVTLGGAMALRKRALTTSGLSLRAGPTLCHATEPVSRHRAGHIDHELPSQSLGPRVAYSTPSTTCSAMTSCTHVPVGGPAGKSIQLTNLRVS